MKSILKVTVTTAIELTKSQSDLIAKTLEKKYKDRNIELIQVIDSSVIAGIKITIGSEEIDATVSSKLEKLHTQLRENI